MVSRGSTVPLYHQIKLDLLDQIQSGQYKDGQRMPSEKELRERYGVSSITVRRALGDLEMSGYITRQPGRGTFALPLRIHQWAGKIGGYPNDLASQGFRVKIDVMEYYHGRPSPDVAQRLGMTTENEILHTIQVVFANDEPVAMGYAHHNYAKYATFTRQELTTDSVLTLLTKKHGIVPAHAERSTQLNYVNESEAAVLGINPNDAIIEVNLTVFDKHEHGLFHVRSLYRGDRYIYQESIRI